MADGGECHEKRDGGRKNERQFAMEGEGVSVSDRVALNTNSIPLGQQRYTLTFPGRP